MMISKRLLGLTSVAVSTALFTILALIHALPTIGSLYQFAFIIFVPGVLAALLMQLQDHGKLLFILYSLGLGLFTLLISGLLLNTTWPLIVSDSHPLTTVKLLVIYDAMVLLETILLVVTSSARDPLRTSVKLSGPKLDRRHIRLMTLVLALPVLAVLGATSLNNGGTDAITLAMLILLGLFVLYIGVTRKPLQSWLYPISLTLIGAALLLMYSLRSWHILGSDIHLEYLVFGEVLHNGQWYAHSAINTSYNACLSITILPTEFALLTHLQPEYVYKLLMQLLFALSPAMIYALARRLIGSKAGFFAGFLFAGQTWFVEQMPALVRQEVALLFFILMCNVLFDRRLKLWQKVTLSTVFTVGVITSHYSTAYIYLGLLALAMIMAYVAKTVLRVPRATPRNFVIQLFLGVALILVWEGVVTTSGSSFASFVRDVGRHAGSAFTAQSVSNGVAQLAFSARTVSNETNLQRIYRAAESTAQSESRGTLYPAALTAGYSPHVVDDEYYSTLVFPRVVSNVLLSVGKVAKLLVIDVFSLAGLIILTLRLRAMRQEEMEYTFLALSSIPLLGTIIFLPVFSNYYNTTRLFLQTFVLLAPVSILAAYFAFSKVREASREVITACVLVIFVWYSCGVMNQLLGGPANITLNQPGGRYDAFYIEDPEVAAARWLAANRSQAQTINTDSMGMLRLQSFGGIVKANTSVFPKTISRDSYVYLYYTNMTKGVGYLAYNNGMVVYQYPTKWLMGNMDMIYNAGSAAILQGQ